MALNAPARIARRRTAGFTVVEMVVVVAIVLILTAGVVGGYANMQRNQRLAASTEKLLSTLHLARSLAISNNAVYHIRLEDYEVVNATTNPVTAKLSKFNHVSVYSYLYSKDAIRVVEEPHPLSADWWNPNFNLTGVNQYTSNPFNNQCLERITFEPGCYMGVQNPVKEVEKGAVLSFYPDGTASENIIYFVTTDDATLYDDEGKAYMARDDKSKPLADRQLVADLRRNAVNGAKRPDGQSYGDASQIRIIQVYKGGMIKLLKREKI